MRTSPSPVVRFALTSLAAGLFVAACGGGGNDDTVNDADARPVIDQGDDDATLTFAVSEIVWAIDGEPIGGEFSFAEPIERERFDAGMRWEVRLDAIGDLGDLEVEVFRRITINDDLIEGGIFLTSDGSVSRTYGPERGVFYLAERFDVTESPDQVVLSLDAFRPVTVQSLLDARARFEAAFDVSADTEQVDLGSDLVGNLDLVEDLPPLAPGPGLSYEYRARGSITLGNGTEVDVDETVSLQVIDPDPIQIDLETSCDGLAAQYLDQLAPQFAEPDLVFVDRLLATTALEQAAEARSCPGPEFVLPVCFGAQELIAESGADDSVAPWSEALEVCPTGRALNDASIVEAEYANGTLQLVVPQQDEEFAALAVAMAVPDWRVVVNAPESDQQRVSMGWPLGDPEGGTEFEVRTQRYTPGAIDRRFDDAADLSGQGGRLVDSWEGEVNGRRAGWSVLDRSGDYEFGGAVLLDDERLLRVEGDVTEGDGRVLSDEAVTALIDCIVESVVVEEWQFGLEPPAPSGDCVAAGLFPGPPLTDDEPDADSAALDEEDGGTESDSSADEETAPAFEPPEGPPTYDAGVVTIPVAVAGDDAPGNLITLTTPAWELDEIIDSTGRSGITLVGPETGASVQIVVTSGSDGDSTIDRLVQPIGSDGTVLSDTAEERAGRSVRLVVSEWETISDDLRSQVVFGLVLDDRRVLTGRVIVPSDGSLDASAISGSILDSLTTAV